MLKSLDKLFTETIKLSPDMWLYILSGVVAVAFLVPLIAGLVAGEFKKVKSIMRGIAAKPETAVAGMKQMPVAIKTRYKNARMGGLKPSMLVTEQACVTEPYKRSLISKVWIIVFVATVICAALAFTVAPLAALTVKIDPYVVDEAAISGVDMQLITALEHSPYILSVVVLALGGIFTLIGGIVGKLSLVGAVNTYGRFALAIDGAPGAEAHVADDGNAEAADRGFVFERQPEQDVAAGAYTEAHEQQQEAYAEAQPVYAEATQGYSESRQAYEEPAVVAPQESDEEIRKRAREEALAQARAAQAQAAAQARAQQQTQAAAARPAQNAANASTVDDVIARIEQIDKEGAPRETMREVATLLQKERAKPENKTPEQQKKLNEALSKLLKAMSAAGRK